MEPSGNLKGTTRTLDGCLGFEKLSKLETELEDGILSRDGWALVDESSRHLFTGDGSVESRLTDNAVIVTLPTVETSSPAMIEVWL